MPNANRDQHYRKSLHVVYTLSPTTTFTVENQYTYITDNEAREQIYLSQAELSNLFSAIADMEDNDPS